MVKKLITFSIKGGSGKTTVTILLAKALQKMGYKIGLYDADITGPKMPTALGIEKSDHGRFLSPIVDVATSKMYPMKFQGFEVFSEAFIFGENPLTWRGADKTVSINGVETKLEGTGLYSMVKQNLESVTFSPDLDYIIYDLPPTSSDSVLSLLENLHDIYACILVCQPTSQSVDDIKRTIGMLKQNKVPLLGMVGNMAEAICPCCHASFYPFIDKSVDLTAFCNERKIPYLVSIPFTSEQSVLDNAFNKLADKVVSCEPVEIWKRGLKVAMEQGIMKNVVMGTARRVAKEESTT